MTPRIMPFVSVRSIWLRGASGLRIHALRREGQGPTSLLLHGAGDHAHVWDAFAEACALRYDVLAVDLRGHGDSGWDPEGRYDETWLLEDLRGLLADPTHRGAILIGHSLGGNLALRLVTEGVCRPAAMVLVDTGPGMCPRGAAHVRRELTRAPRVYESVEAFAERLASLHPLASPETIESLARHGLRRRVDGRFERKADPRSVRRLRGIDGGDLWERLGRVPCPTLVVRGRASALLPKDAATRTALSLPRGRLVEVDRAGHGVMLDNPEDFTRETLGFLTKAIGDR